MYNSVIAATGVYHPQEVITNEELVTSFNQYVDFFNAQHQEDIKAGTMSALEYSSSTFIEKASGILQRYVVDKEGILDIHRMRPFIAPREAHSLSFTADMALKAIEPTLQRANKPSQAVEAVIVACSNYQRPYPAIAIEVQQALNAHGFAFDMNVACSSATFAIAMADSLIRCGQVESALVVNPEICSAHLDYTDRESHFIFGDACSSILLEREDKTHSENAWKILSSHLSTDYSTNIMNQGGFLNRCETHTQAVNEINLFKQNGRKVFKEVVPKAFEHIITHCEKHQLNSQDIKRYWLHQANRHMNDLIAKKLLGRDPIESEAPLILDQYANTGSAGSIIAFHHHQHDCQRSDKGIICSFGAGYSVGSLLVEKL